MGRKSIALLTFPILFVFLTYACLFASVNASPDSVTLRPNAVGTYQEWGYSSGGHWQDTSDLSDSTYIYSGTDEQRDIQDLADPLFSGADTINSVTVWFRATVEEGAGGGPEKAATLIRTYSTDYEGAQVTISDSPTYTDYSTVHTTNPYTTNAWTKSEVTALQAGVILKSIGSGEVVRCSEIWVVVDYTVSGPPPVSEFPFGLTIEIALILAVVYIGWKKRHSILQ